MQYQILEDNNVSKFIFKSDDMIAEAVLYECFGKHAVMLLL